MTLAQLLAWLKAAQADPAIQAAEAEFIVWLEAKLGAPQHGVSLAQITPAKLDQIKKDFIYSKTP